MPVSTYARRGAAILSVVLLTLLVVEGWAPRLLDREDQPATDTSAAARGERGEDVGARQAREAGLDVDGVVERTSHTPVPVSARPGVLEIGDRAYQARFDERGFSYRPTDADAGLELSVTGVERGSAPLRVAPGRWAADGPAAVRPLAPGITERVGAAAGTLEWDVVLGAPPAGHGDLRVTAALRNTSGPPTRIQGEEGPAWRFTLPDGVAVTVDEVVVTDASGVELHRGLPHVDGDRIALEVPGSVLDEAVYPLTVDPTVSGTHPITSGGFNPSVAFDGTNYMVVWEQQFSGSSDIFGAKVSPSGSILAGPFRVSSSPNGEFHADIAWNGSSFLVVWEFQEGASTLSDYDINGQRLTSAGGLIGGPFVVYGPSSSAQRIDERHPSVTSNRLDFFVTWEGNPNASTLGWDIYGKTVSRNGANGFATRYAEASVDETSPDVAWNGTRYLITYTFRFSPTDHDVYGQLVNPFIGFTLSDGTRNGDKDGGARPLSTPVSDQFGIGVASEGDGLSPCAGCTGARKNYLVVWGDTRTGAVDVYGTRVDGFGTPLDGSGFRISTSAQAEQPSTKSVAYNGSYLVAWLDFSSASRRIAAARVGTDGRVLDNPAITVVDTAAVEQSVAVSRGPGDDWGVAFEEYPGDGSERLRFRTVSAK